MSRIGKKPVKVPSSVKVDLSGGQITISGSKHSLKLALHETVEVSYDSAAHEIAVSRKSDETLAKAMHGTTRAHIANMIKGVTEGYVKSLKIFGTGYGVKEQGKQLHVTVGYAKPAVLPIPEDVEIEIKVPNAKGNEVPAEFFVKSPDKQKAGQFAAQIRKVRPPEPYNGKGIRYGNEVIKRKEGKAFGSA